MRVGVPREVTVHEYRVGIAPSGVHELTRSGHDVLVEHDAGLGSAIHDEDYAAAGASIIDTADEVWAGADLVLKVKEPIAQEYPRLRAGQVLVTYLHLAASAACTDALLASGTTAVAYETVQHADGSLPLLYPMSEVAGVLAPQVGAHALMSTGGGRGVLLGGVTGVRRAQVAVIGAGVAGRNAVAIAAGMGADVTVLDTDVTKLRALDRTYRGRITTVVSNTYEIEHAVLGADLVIGAVLVAGARAPQLVPDTLVARMRHGSVLVDIAIDQGGCFEGSHPTTHADPTFPVHTSLFYCVANMPGVVPHTSTYALTNVTLPYVLRIAEDGLTAAARADPALRRGVNVVAGELTNPAVAAAHGRATREPMDALAEAPSP